MKKVSEENKEHPKAQPHLRLQKIDRLKNLCFRVCCVFQSLFSSKRHPKTQLTENAALGMVIFLHVRVVLRFQHRGFYCLPDIRFHSAIFFGSDNGKIGSLRLSTRLLQSFLPFDASSLPLDIWQGESEAWMARKVGSSSYLPREATISTGLIDNLTWLHPRNRS